MKNQLFARVLLPTVVVLYSLFSLVMAAEPVAAPASLDRPSVLSSLAGHGALLSVALAGNRLVAVGERGHVVLSDDQGRHWEQAAVPVSVTLTATDFVSDRLGWAVGHGGVILRTQDGGETWVRQTDGRTLGSTLAQARQEAYARGDELLSQKLQRLVSEGADKPLLDVMFLDEHRGFAVGAYGLMLQTDDGGEHWKSAAALLDSDEDRHIYGIRSRGNEILLVGEQGLLYRSVDAGARFTKMISPADGSWFGVVCDNHDRLLLGLRGALWLSSDDGTRWRQLKVDTQYSFVAGIALGGGKGYLVADEGGGIWQVGGDSMPRRLAESVGYPLASLVRLRDGDIVVSGLLGAIGIKPSGL